MYRRAFAGLTLVLCGCGSSKLATDAAPSGGADGGSHGLVTVTVLDYVSYTGMPAAGVPVVFDDASGSQVVMTGTDGKAAADVMAGASVTAVTVPATGGPRGPVLRSVLATKPGDQITIGITAPTGSQGSFTVNFSTVAAWSNAQYLVESPCGMAGGNGTATLTIQPACMQDPMEILIVATDPTTHAPLGYLDAPAVHYVPGGSVTLGAPTMPIGQFTITANDVPAGLMPLSAGLGALQYGVSGSLGDAPGTDTIMLPHVEAVSTSLDVDTNKSGYGAQLLLARLPGDASSYTLDVPQVLLPWLGTPSFDPATLTIHQPFSVEGVTGTPPDLYDVWLDYTATSGSTLWEVYAPAPMDIRLPAIPASVYDVTPTANPSPNFEAVTAFEWDSIAGYDQARANPEGITNWPYLALPPATRTRLDRVPIAP